MLLFMIVGLCLANFDIKNCLKCNEKDELICDSCTSGYIGHYCIPSNPGSIDTIIFTVLGILLQVMILIWFLVSLCCLSIDSNIWIMIHTLQLTKLVTLLDAEYSATYKFFYDKVLAPINLTFMPGLDHQTSNERFYSYGFTSD